MLFAIVIERELIRWDLFPELALNWLQYAGSIAASCFLIYTIVQALAGFVSRQDKPPSVLRTPAMRSFATISGWIGVLGYVFILAVVAFVASGNARLGDLVPRAGMFTGRLSKGDIILGIAGAIAILGVMGPMLADLITRIRFGRIWALAKLSLKEAVRGKVIAVFGFIALIFLFADWFVPYREEDQIRNYVRVVYWSLTPLFILMAALLGSFSIPNDVKNQTIHTIVTKPVEKFEIVLGRFLGYGLILTMGLVATGVLSLGYFLRSVNEDAARQSFKARVPQFGFLKFHGTKSSLQGENVGREWDYRSYISAQAPNAEPQYAMWSFYDLPNDLRSRTEPIAFEFTFDIFRLTKGEEDKDVYCTFQFTPGDMDKEDLSSTVQAMAKKRDQLQGEARRTLEQDPSLKNDRAALQAALTKRFAEIRAETTKEFKVHEVAAVGVTDYKTQSVSVPPEFFASLPTSKAKVGEEPAPDLKVYVSVDRSRYAQMVGVARYDLYLLYAVRPFWQNFLKGMLGLWAVTMLVLGLAVSMSAYLNAVISFFTTLFLYFGGLFSEYLAELARGNVAGGGPSESFYRLVTRRVQAAPLDDSPTTSVLRGADNVFTWLLGRIMNIFPDVNRYDLHAYVAEGFDISWSQMLLLNNIIPMAAYLLPWSVLAYYLMNYREIANPR